MKTLLKVFFAMIIASLIVSCGTKKPKHFGPQYDKPCYEESKSTPSQFREIGYGIDAEFNIASRQALDDAYIKMKNRLYKEYRSVVDTITIVSSNKAEEKEYKERAFRDIVEGKLNSSDNPCYDYYHNEQENRWYYFYVISIDKFNIDELIRKELNKE